MGYALEKEKYLESDIIELCSLKLMKLHVSKSPFHIKRSEPAEIISFKQLVEIPTTYDLRLTTAVAYQYTWDGPVLRSLGVGGNQIIEVRDGAGTILWKHVYGAGIDEPIYLKNGMNRYYYTTDGLGSVSELTNSSGTKIEKYAYDVYGKPTIMSAGGVIRTVSSYNNSYMFTGREYDAENSLYYYRARYYDPLLGRFLETDPLGYWDSLNLYSYCINNPWNWNDPWGLWQDPSLIGPTRITTPVVEQPDPVITTPVVDQPETVIKDPATDPQNNDTVDPVPDNPNPNPGYETSKGGKKNVSDTGMQGLSDNELESIYQGDKSDPKWSRAKAERKHRERKGQYNPSQRRRCK